MKFLFCIKEFFLPINSFYSSITKKFRHTILHHVKPFFKVRFYFLIPINFQKLNLGVSICLF